jgi:ATP-binding cassette subfamily B protein
VMSQLQPLFTKGAIDQITNLLSGGHADVVLVAVFAGLIFLTDVGQTLLSNVAGYLGDILAAKLRKVMSERYFAHLMTLPQSYFDQELTGTIINRMNRGIMQITDYIQSLTNNFLQFVFSTILSLVIVFYFSWQVGLMLALLYPIFIWLTTKTSKRWQSYQKEINSEQGLASPGCHPATGAQCHLFRYLRVYFRRNSSWQIHLGHDGVTHSVRSPYPLADFQY